MLRILCLLFTAAVYASAAPTLELSTFFGGEFGEQANDVAVDSEGNIYLVGQTRDVPAEPGSYSSVVGATFDVFVLKVNPDATEILYLAVFGGGARERGVGITVDAEGAAYVTGVTFSEDFPVTAGAAQETFGGGTRDAFVAKLSPDGSALEWSTYLGGSTFEDSADVVVDEQGRVWVAGMSGSQDFPVTANALKSEQGENTRSAFVAEIAQDGSAFVYASLLGGTGRDEATALAAGAAGELWVAGTTASADFPVTQGAFQTALTGVDDGFVVKLSTTGDPAIEAATLLGGEACLDPFAGSPCDLPQAVYADAAGVLVVGNTITSDFPLAGDPVQTSYGGGVAFGDAFASVFSHDLTRLEASTYLGGASEDRISDVLTGRSGAVYLVGTTGSSNFPLTEDAYQSTFGDLDEAFLVQMEPDLSRLLYSTWLGGTGGDRGYGIARHGDHEIIIVGESSSIEFPSTPGTIKPDITLVRAEGGDAYVAKFRFELVPRISAAGIVNAASFAGGPIAPGEIISVFARGLTGDESGALTLGDDGRVTTELADVRLLVDGTPAPLTFVGSDQVNAVVPYAAELSPVARVSVERGGISSESVTLRAEATAPGLFTFGGGVGQAAALNEDGTVNSPENPAPRGSVVVLFGTGEGQTDPGGVDGAVTGETLPRPLGAVTARVGDVGAETLYAGAAPGLVAGVIQINVRIPVTVIGGPQTPVSFTAGFRRSQAGVTIAVEP